MSFSSEQLQRRLTQLMRGLLLVIFALGFRAAYLTCVKAPELEQLAERPGHRIERVSAPRGCIFDRAGVALATNRLRYEAGVCYRDFMSYPAVKAIWVEGKRQKTYPRRDLVQQLCLLLSKELEMNATRIEDFIYSESALNPSQTIVLSSHLDEQAFYRLKAIESLIPGLRVRMSLERHYPLGALAGQVIGYVGKLDHAERQKQLMQLASLQSQLAIEEDSLLRDLLTERLEQTRARYLSFDQSVGKVGIERIQENQLRGEDGQKWLHLNARGFMLDPGQEKPPVAGKDIRLCIDSELQLLAEQLLAESELFRDNQLLDQHQDCPQTWVKGGSIVVMDPHTGHLLALASSPRFNPEAYTHREADQSQLPSLKMPPVSSRHFWLEDRSWLAGLWDGKWELWREIYQSKEQSFGWQSQTANWQRSVEAISGPTSPVPQQFMKFSSIDKVWQISWAFSQIREYLGQDLSSWAILNFLYSRTSDQAFWPPSELIDVEPVRLRWSQVEQVLPLTAYRKILDESVASLNNNFDKMVLIELAGLLVDEKAFSPTNCSAFSQITPEMYREHAKGYIQLKAIVKEQLEQWHRAGPFAKWREENQKKYLSQVRRQERANSLPAKPYIYYLEYERASQFQTLWNQVGIDLVNLLIVDGASDPAWAQMALAIRDPLNKTLEATGLKNRIEQLQVSSRLMDSASFERYLASMLSFEELDKPLWATYPFLNQGKPAQRLELAKYIYPKYGVGYLVDKGISYLGPPGSIYKLVIAYEALMQRYSSGQAMNWDSMSPFRIFDSNHLKNGRMILGKFANGREIHQIHKGGRMPKSQKRHIGEIDLLGAIEASSNPYFSLLTQELKDPAQDIIQASYNLGWGRVTGVDLPNERAGSIPFDLGSNRTGLYTTAIGQHTLLGTPIQAAVMLSAFANGGQIVRPKVVDDGLDPEIRDQIEMPDRVREYMFEGMRRVVFGKYGSARSMIRRSYASGTTQRKQINQMVPYMIGKTSTAEFVEVFGISPPKEIVKHCNVWFGGIVFDQPLYKDQAPEKVNFRNRRAELVIVVNLHMGHFGKDTFPIAALLAHRWKEIQSRRSGSNPSKESHNQKL